MSAYFSPAQGQRTKINDDTASAITHLNILQDCIFSPHLYSPVGMGPNFTVQVFADVLPLSHILTIHILSTLTRSLCIESAFTLSRNPKAMRDFESDLYIQYHSDYEQYNNGIVLCTYRMFRTSFYIHTCVFLRQHDDSPGLKISLTSTMLTCVTCLVCINMLPLDLLPS